MLKVHGNDDLLTLEIRGNDDMLLYNDGGDAAGLLTVTALSTTLLFTVSRDVACVRVSR